MFDPKKFTEYATDKLYRYCLDNNIKTLVTGVSGGLDSAVVLALTKIINELSNNDIKNVGISLPICSNNNTNELALSIVNANMVMKKFTAFGISFGETRLFETITEAFAELNRPLVELGLLNKDKQRLSNGNIAARLRMITLYYIANMTNGIVMSTDNYSEYFTGFWTRHGDEGDYGLIQQLWKGTEVIELAQYLEVPEAVIEAKPTDGLGIVEGGDEAQLGAPYPVVDEILKQMLTDGFNFGAIEPADRQIEANRLLEKNELEWKIGSRCLNSAFKRHGQIVITRDELEGIGVL